MPGADDAREPASSRSAIPTSIFQDVANLDGADMWPIMLAATRCPPSVEENVVELVKTALSLGRE